MVRALKRKRKASDKNLLILVDEYDRLANKLMFENPLLYNKLIGSGISTKNPDSSPIRSF